MSRHKTGWERCEMSGETQMLAWGPDDDYPGASVCIGCSYGVLVRKRSAHAATSEAGYEGLAGTLLTHYVRRYKGRAEELSYRKPRGLA